MGRKAIDLTNQKFSHLIVLKKDISKKGKHAYWICKCDCGNIITVRADSLKSGHTTSCGCIQNKNKDKDNLNQNSNSKLKTFNKKSRQFDLTNQKFGHLIVLKKDISKKYQNAYWICKCDCGNIVSIRGDHLKSGNTMTCGCLKISKGEDKIKNILSFLGIVFIQQKTFNDLKYKYNLRFDFFLPECNCCIEYQGKQHYIAVDYFGGTKEFEEIKIRDEIKRQWCEENNIKLIEISYVDYNKIDKDYILKIINN